MQERAGQGAVVGLLGITLDCAATVAGDLGRRRLPLPVKKHVMRQSGTAVRSCSYRRRLLISGSSSGEPNWHQPRHSSPANQRGVGAARVDTLLLLVPVLCRSASLPNLDMEAHAPAAAPHAVICLDQPRERRPRVHVQGPDGEGGGRFARSFGVAHGHRVSMHSATRPRRPPVCAGGPSRGTRGRPGQGSLTERRAVPRARRLQAVADLISPLVVDYPKGQAGRAGSN